MTTDTQQLHVIVRGRVQGVNFRYSTQSLANRLGLSGWVRNQPDGSVEVLAEGSSAALGQLLSFLRHGPQHAVVSQLEHSWQPATYSLNPFEARW